MAKSITLFDFYINMFGGVRFVFIIYIKRAVFSKKTKTKCNEYTHFIFKIHTRNISAEDFN